jgi:hypothetical protein
MKETRLFFGKKFGLANELQGQRMETARAFNAAILSGMAHVNNNPG